MSNINYLSEILEPYTNGVIQIEVDHAYIHGGILFETSTQFTLTAGASRYIAITTPNTDKTIHYRPAAIVTTADKLTFDFYEAGTFTGGTILTPSNHNRRSTITAETVVKDGVTSTLDGTFIYKGFIGGGTGVGQARSGDQRGDKNEWVLKKNVIYLIKFTNGSTESNTINVNNLWYEQES